MEAPVKQEIVIMKTQEQHEHKTLHSRTFRSVVTADAHEQWVIMVFAYSGEHWSSSICLLTCWKILCIPAVCDWITWRSWSAQPNGKYRKCNSLLWLTIQLYHWKNSSNFIIIKTSENKKKKYITATSAMLADGVKVPSSLTLKRETMLKEQLPTGVTIKLFQSIWNAIHQNQGRESTVLIRKLGVLLRKRRMFDPDAMK